MNEWYEFVTYELDLALENLCLNLDLSTVWLYNIDKSLNLSGA